jgi:hypothetical protein
MKSGFAIAVGALVGLLLAGLVAPAVTLVLPPWLRGPAVLWSSAVAVVSVTASFFWLAFARRGGK